MSDLHAYRASDELAAALREHAAADDAFCREHVEPFDRDNPGHELLWARRAMTMDKRAVGFCDGEDDVPSGLSRASTREELRPKKTEAGQAWQDVLERMADRPKASRVLHEFGVPEAARGGGAPSGGTYVSATQWADTGETGVIVFNGGDLAERPFGRDAGGLTEHLTPIPLSEFYAIKERLDAERDTAEVQA